MTTALPSLPTSTMTISELLAEFIPEAANCNIRIFGLAHDSRQVKAGDLFFACTGYATDGRNYIEQAINNGAVAVVSEAISDSDNATGSHNHSKSKLDASVSITAAPIATVPIFEVVDLRHLLGKIAAKFYGYPTREMTVVGITGTNGKTSCSHFIAQLINQIGQSRKEGKRANEGNTTIPACGFIGTLGMGLPNSLTPLNNTTPDPFTLQKQLAAFKANNISHVAMEVSSHSLDQGRVAGIDFSLAVFTNLTRDHLDYHKTMEEYAAAKKQLFAWPSLRAAIINLDDPYGRELSESLQNKLSVYGYSIYDDDNGDNKNVNKDERKDKIRTIYNKTKQSADNLILAYNIDIDHYHSKTTAAIITPWGDGKLTSNLLGKFNLSNLLAVIATLCLMGFDLQTVLQHIASLQPFAGRMQPFGGSDLPLVVVDYSHTPDALEKALTTLREYCLGDLWCVFGCGGDRDHGKRPIMGKIAETCSDHVVITDDNPRTESSHAIIADIEAGLANPQDAIIEPDRKSAITFALKHAKPKDVVLVAGKGHEDYQIIGTNKIHFSDIEIIQTLLTK